MCYLKTSGGSWLPSLKAQAALCQPLVTVVTVIKNSKNQDYSYSMLWGMAWVCHRQLSAELGSNSVPFDQRQG